MNPPSALHGAMSRDRKPFTYTPGGLDLSEIKSERMAKRLMRNAMNQGVPETSAALQSPPTPTTPIAVPNFNCLPVQVFPTFNLPANPKSLLRTRSNPEPPKNSPSQRVPMPFQNMSNVKDICGEQFTDINKPAYSYVNNNTKTNNHNIRPVSMYEYNAPNNSQTLPRNYGSDGYTAPLLPEICYEAEYFQIVPNKTNMERDDTKLDLQTNDQSLIMTDNLEVVVESVDLAVDSISKNNIISEQIIVTKPSNVFPATENEQKEVKVVKKQVKKENKVETHNGEKNGDENTEAELIVKLPTKKSGAQTETKVEVVQKTLPDGSVEEIKTTTTKTTIDGKTEITTKTETTIIPKEDEEEVEEEEDEEETEEVATDIKKDNSETSKKIEEKKVVDDDEIQENIIKKEERSETTTTKKVVVIQSAKKEEQESEEEEEEEEDIKEPVVLENNSDNNTIETKAQVAEENKVKTQESQEIEEETEEMEEVDEEYDEVEEKQVSTTVDKQEPIILENKKEEIGQESEECEEDEEEEEDEETEVKVEKIEVAEKPPTKEESEPKEVKKPDDEKEEDDSEYTEEEIESDTEIPKESNKLDTSPKNTIVDPKEEVVTEKEVEIEVEEQLEEKKTEEQAPPIEVKTPIKEPSVPLEKVEDVEIKPITAGQDYITKSHTETTEIRTSSNDQPSGGLSTQTEFNRIENIVTVNRTTKTLDHNYEQLTQQGVPTLKTYFAPNRERVSISPSRPYQPVYPSEPQQERRHSLLLERLSLERQLPTSDIYQNTYQQNQSYEQQRQWSQEPQSEVVTVSNVKPSSITNSQWYQQNKNENVLYNNVTSGAPISSTQPWTQAQSPQPKPQHPQYQPQYQTQPQPQSQPQSQYLPQSQPQYEPQSQYLPQSQQQYQPQSQQQYQPQHQSQSQYQPSTYSEHTVHDSSKITSNLYQQNNYTTYTPKSNLNSKIDSVPTINIPNQYSYSSKESNTSQQYSSSYVPPPWEQDSSYVPDLNQNYYQTPQAQLTTPNTFAPSNNQTWNPTPASQSTPKFSKPAPTSYVPPAPNQSFVKTVTVEQPKLPGRKTYYSEYERRYITVPESTYIPSETKYQPQPDPSPQYYYDNSEPNETVEPQWRRELREFTEKSSQNQQQYEQTVVRPPWEEDTKYVKTPSSAYTPTPTWSQTLKPRSWHERSFESEYVGSQEWPKSNTLGRGRPASSYIKSKEAPIPERSRGVSVDRYNPNNYQSPIPSEHPPVQSHTLIPTPPAKSYHNPHVPAYHARASAEPRDQSASYPQPRKWTESRDSPIQSRSFKYLQWITGTEN